MNTYNLVSLNDGNDVTELCSTTFQDAVDEALEVLEWYIIDEEDYFVGVNNTDANDTIDLSEHIYEDAQYEILEKLGYYITSPE